MMFDPKNIISDFPILAREVHGKRLVYLDSAATAQKPQCVIDSTERVCREINSNVHRGVHHLSGEMTNAYELARERVRTFLNAKRNSEVIFTSGATAAINLVAYSWGGANLQEGDNIILTEMEHHSNIVPWQYIAGVKGVEIRVLPFDDKGALRMEELDAMLDSRTKMVAVTQASNTLGTRPDLPTIITKAHAVGAKVLIDGCQGAVHGGVDVQALDCDFYALSAHKLYAPTGIGALYGKQELLQQMPPFLYGGDMVDRVSFDGTTFAEPPLKFEAGTPNFIGAVGFGEAIEYLSRFDAKEVEEHENRLRKRMESGLGQIEGVTIYGRTESKSPIVSFNIEGIHHSDIGMILDKLGVAIRTGMHCAEPVMRHFGVTGMCRASITLYNTEEDVDIFLESVQRAVNMLR